MCLLRAVPEIILRGAGPHFFSDPSTPRTHIESEPPRPAGHISALINPASLRIKYALTPRTSYPPPHPSDTLSTKHPPPTGQKRACGPPTPLRIISGTALTGTRQRLPVLPLKHLHLQVSGVSINRWNPLNFWEGHY